MLWKKGIIKGTKNKIDETLNLYFLMKRFIFKLIQKDYVNFTLAINWNLQKYFRFEIFIYFKIFSVYYWWVKVMIPASSLFTGQKFCLIVMFVCLKIPKWTTYTVEIVCFLSGITNHEEYSLVRELAEEEKEKTMTLKRDKSIAKDQKKLEEMRRKLHTDDDSK